MVSMYRCVRGTRTQPLICVGCSVPYWVSCAIIEGGFFEIAFFVVIDTHLPRLEALAYVLPHFDALTHVVIRVSSAFIFQTFAEVCYKSVLNLRKAYIFKSLLKVYYRSGFNESSKAFIFQSLLKVYTLSKILLWIKPSYFSLENACYSWCMHQTRLFSSASVVPQS